MGERMNSVDKKIAIGGIVVIIFLSIIALFLLLGGKKESPVKVVKEKQTVELNDAPAPETVSNISNDAASTTNGPVVSRATDVKNTTVASATANTEDSNGMYVKKKLISVRNNDAQMQELYGYWHDGRMEAVYDLIKLERIRNITKELNNTDNFYFYGELSEDGKPNGEGLAIYANDTYYFGDWKSGLRDGRGILLQIFPDKTVSFGAQNGIKEHFYTGEFKADLPNGRGQENYVYNFEELEGNENLYNVIGGFKNGYYNDDILIYTVDKKGTMYEWYANANAGSFKLQNPDMISTTNKRPVWYKGNDNDHTTDESDSGFYWLLDEQNSGWGVYGLKK